MTNLSPVAAAAGIPAIEGPGHTTMMIEEGHGEVTGKSGIFIIFVYYGCFIPDNFFTDVW